MPRELGGDIRDRDGIEPGKEDGGVPDPQGLVPEESELLASGNHCSSERGSVIAVAAGAHASVQAGSQRAIVPALRHLAVYDHHF